MKLYALIIFIVTFILFFFKAMIHYNIGKNGKPYFHIPDKNELIHITYTVFIFSILSGVISSYIIKHVHNNL
jgi:tetrahydromethanopterin S-methyltransferase subunit D